MYAIYSFGNIVEFDNKIYAVKLLAKHYKAEKSKIEKIMEGQRIEHYNLEAVDIKILLPTHGGSVLLQLESRGAGNRNSSAKINVIHLLKNVKLNKKNNNDNPQTYYEFLENEKNQ